MNNQELLNQLLSDFPNREHALFKQVETVLLEQIDPTSKCISEIDASRMAPYPQMIEHPTDSPNPRLTPKGWDVLQFIDSLVKNMDATPCATFQFGDILNERPMVFYMVYQGQESDPTMISLALKRTVLDVSTSKKYNDVDSTFKWIRRDHVGINVNNSANSSYVDVRDVPSLLLNGNQIARNTRRGPASVAIVHPNNEKFVRSLIMNHPIKLQLCDSIPTSEIRVGYVGNNAYDSQHIVYLGLDYHNCQFLFKCIDINQIEGIRYWITGKLEVPNE